MAGPACQLQHSLLCIHPWSWLLWASASWSTVQRTGWDHSVVLLWIPLDLLALSFKFTSLSASWINMHLIETYWRCRLLTNCWIMSSIDNLGSDLGRCLPLPDWWQIDAKHNKDRVIDLARTHRVLTDPHWDPDPQNCHSKEEVLHHLILSCYAASFFIDILLEYFIFLCRQWSHLKTFYFKNDQRRYLYLNR